LCKILLIRGELKRGAASVKKLLSLANELDLIGESKRGVSPSSKQIFPLSFEGEGDKGGEVDNSLFESFPWAVL